MNIVMLVKDRPRLTAQAIETLYLYTDPEKFNLTVLDDGSGLKTRGVLEMCLAGKDNAVSVRISRSKGIVGLARNLGIAASEQYWGRGDGLLYLSDNDAAFTAGWQDKLRSAYRDVTWPVVRQDMFGIVGGYNHPYHAVVGAETGTPSPPVPYCGGEIREYYALGGFSWLLHWDLWDKFGPFQAHAVGVCRSEDHEFCQRVRTADGKVGAVWPHVVLNAGLTSTFGEPAVGHEKMERIPGLVME